MVGSAIAAQPVPLTRDDSGTLRVNGTRIPLERIVEAHQAGATPETIVQWFDSLRLADVYSVLSYYLNHPDEVETYLREREAQAAEVRRRIEAGQPPRPGLRAELLARRARTEAGDTASGQ
jgi:uncharacterized protein (DUF433 family)